MTKKLVVAVAAVLAFAAPALAADLKYTMHIEAKPAANGAGDPISQMASGMLTQMFPPDGIDQLVVASEKGMRAEQKQEFAGVKAGAVMLIKPDGTQYVLDPVAKTYYKMPAIPAEMAAMFKPKVVSTKPGVFETIDGMKCERVTVNMAMPLPGMDPSQLPPGMPTELPIIFEMWLSDSVKMPAGAAGTSLNGLMKQFGLDQLPELKKFGADPRLPVKTVLSLFGVDMIMSAKEIKTESAASDLFDIPKDYTEVPPPGGRGF